MIEGILRWLGYEKRAYVQSFGPPRDPLLAEWFGASSLTSAGVNVTEDTALNLSAVFRAVSLIAGSVSTLPLRLYERISDTERQWITDHPLALLLDQPNDEMDGATFRETLQGHVLTWGNAYAEIERNGGGRPIALHPLSPALVTPKRIDRVLVYEVRSDTAPAKTLAADAIFHLKGLGGDGLVGYSPIRYARQSIGLGIATEEFGARFFGQGTRLAAHIERPQGAPTWTEEAIKRFKQNIADVHQGVGNSHRVAVLEDGMKWVNDGIPPDEAQFLQTRKFQVTEIARWYGIPPHLLYDLERATFSNIEQQGLEFLTYCLRYWLSKWERAIRRSLISDARYYVEHVTQDLVRADLQARYTAYNVGRSGGWLSINDIRRAENLPPVDGGDTYLQPLNMQPVGQQAPQPPADATAAQRSLLVSTLDRLIRNEANALRRAAKKPDEFPVAVDDFYRSYEPVLRETLEPIFNLDAALGQPRDADTFIRKHIADSRAAVLAVAPEQVELTVAGWATRAQQEIQ